MSLVYVGDCSFQETENSGRMIIDPWGLDTLTREWEGRKDLLDDFLVSVSPTSVLLRTGVRIQLSRSRQIPDSTYKQMFMTTIEADVGRAFAKITATYRGIENGREPLPVVEFGYRLQEVTLPYITDILVPQGSASGTFTYNAPTSTYKYWQRKQPRRKKYANRMEYIQDALEIRTRTGIPGEIKFFKGQTLTTNQPNFISLAQQGVAGAYNAMVECFSEDIRFQQDGQWWQCTETNIITLTPLDFLQSGYVAQIG